MNRADVHLAIGGLLGIAVATAAILAVALPH